MQQSITIHQGGVSMDVLVIGAGPVGLTMAAELARRSVKVRIIDKSLTPTTLSKALAVHARTLEVFEQMGLAETFLSRGLRVQGMTAWMGDTNRTAHIGFQDLDSPYPFILDIPQNQTETILIEHLSKLQLQVERGTELVSLQQTNETVTVELRDANGQTEFVAVPWVIGCDGAHSTVRHQLGVPFEGTQYPDSFLLGDVRVDWSLPEDQMHVFVTEGGLLAAFPYGNQRYRLMANATVTRDPNSKTAPTQASEATLAELQQFVRDRSPVETQISDPIWISWFHSHLRHVTQTRVDRVFLVGDSAHIHSPAGGQGMNTGIQDAYNLAWKLALVVSGNATDKLLDSYQEERMAVAESVLKLSDGLLSTVTANRPIVKLLRDHLAPVLLNTRMVRHHMTEQISELAIHYRDSSIVRSSLSSNHLFSGARIHAGDRAPDVQYRNDQGDAQRFYHLLRGTEHSLFLLSERAEVLDSLAQKLTPWRQQFALYSVRADQAAPSTSGYETVRDPAQAIRHRYNLPPDSVLIIRPDGYIGFLSDTVDIAKVMEYIEGIFKP